MSEKTLYLPEGTLCGRDETSVYDGFTLQKAIRDETIIEGRVLMCNASHDMIIDLPPIRGVIPRSEGALGISDGSVRDIALISRVGKNAAFCVTGMGLDASGNSVALLSRRRAQQLCTENYLDRLVPGDIIKARITHLEPFGAFCDIGCGIVSLIPIDCISVSRISHPSDRFYVGQDIYAVVSGRDENGRIALSHKELLGTWEQNAALFCPGSTVSGFVRMVEDYGCFVELTPNLAGLAEPKSSVYAGQEAAVYIKSIIPEKMKVKLIIIDSSEPVLSKPSNNYFLTSGHITEWRYSPQCCERYTGTYFGE